jgi:hypothetical protein
MTCDARVSLAERVLSGEARRTTWAGYLPIAEQDQGRAM